jgi:hypothetical protein
MASSSPSEHEIQQRIRLACGRGAVRLGLCEGSSDLIGLRSLEITPQQVDRLLIRGLQDAERFLDLADQLAAQRQAPAQS